MVSIVCRSPFRLQGRLLLSIVVLAALLSVANAYGRFIKDAAPDDDEELQTVIYPAGEATQPRARMVRSERLDSRSLKEAASTLDMAEKASSYEVLADGQTRPQSPRDVDCVFDNWQAWSDCPVSCGSGKQTRGRTVKRRAEGSGKACQGKEKEIKDCSVPQCPVHCKVGSWSRWGACSKTCGGGELVRTRSLEAPRHGGIKCPAEGSKQSQKCNVKPCPRDCKWSNWDTWSSCTKTCGRGTRSRSRSIVVEAAHGGKVCTGGSKEDEPCNTHKCAIDCRVEGWAGWSQCSKSCDGGTQFRTRGIIVKSQHGGKGCPTELKQEQKCGAKACPVDCVWSAWGIWNKCSHTCGGGKSTRFRTVKTPAAHGGKQCVGSKSQTMQCGQHSCPVDCELADWDDWSSCSISCGSGYATRKREVKVSAQYGGKECSNTSKLVETKDCSKALCPVDCRWNGWQDWRQCSVTCGNGTSVRMRHVQTPPQHGGRACIGGNSESRLCNTKTCPVHCKLSDWSSWSKCSVSCGNGTKTRKRHVKVPADWGGTPCPQNFTDSTVCKLRECPQDGLWAAWGAWSKCSSSCGNGTMHRSRELRVQPRDGGKEAEGESSQRRACPDLPHCPIDCKWDEWSSWRPCSVTCGEGVNVRTRHRAHYEAYGGHLCYGSQNDTKACHGNPCPVDCKLTDWGDWGACSASCGNATHVRTRSVTTSAKFGGKACGSLSETGKCTTTPPCPVDCAWNVWNEWSDCSKSCGGGEKFRNRTHKAVAANGGRICEGTDAQTVPCNTTGCPKDCTWGSWGVWTNCSKTCGGGARSKTRSITQEGVFGGKACDKNDGKMTEVCNKHHCPVNCVWGEWGNWSRCTKTCESGSTHRERVKITIEAYGGTPCRGDSLDQKMCNTQECPRNCVWGEWTPWSQCSTTCGGGKSTRFRDVAITAKNGGDACEGRGNESVDCSSTECPVDCAWTLWSDWSACSRSCTEGVRHRNRKIKTEARFGGRECDGSTSSASQPCNQNAHCPIDCSFKPWEEWSACSTSCGYGEIIRTRVKVDARHGGKPCSQDMVQRKECFANTSSDPRCPNTTTSTSPPTAANETLSWDPASAKGTSEEKSIEKTADNDAWMKAYLKDLNKFTGKNSFPAHIGSAAVTGSLVVTIGNPDGFSADPAVAKVFVQVFAKLGGVSESATQVRLIAGGASLLATMRRRLDETGGNVAVEYSLQMASNSAASSTAESFAQVDVAQLTDTVNVALKTAGLKYTVTAKSLSVSVVSAPPPTTTDAPAVQKVDPIDDDGRKEVVKSATSAAPAPSPGTPQRSSANRFQILPTMALIAFVSLCSL
eukprot:TRINITY_DN5769_c1_g2_i1.p1 TRINITY_DN5769_c1_g2~~TRINITY_DN5769_c1_g2_i1.p1  ORF type:complete len:1326 (+),score=179.83 TRINITY_DN5769_c1_g2_i1:153-4130(+)